MMLFWLPILFVPFLLLLWWRPGMMRCGMHDAYHQMPPTSGGANDPLTIARVRLARGEITPAQYEEIKQALSR